MSRIMGDSLVAGPEAMSAPEMVTVRLTRGQAEALSELAQSALEDAVLSSERSYMSRVVETLRAQIGGSR